MLCFSNYKLSNWTYNQLRVHFNELNRIIIFVVHSIKLRNYIKKIGWIETNFFFLLFLCSYSFWLICWLLFSSVKSHIKKKEKTFRTKKKWNLYKLHTKYNKIFMFFSNTVVLVLLENFLFYMKTTNFIVPWSIEIGFCLKTTTTKQHF